MQWEDIDAICAALTERHPPLDSRGMTEHEIVAAVTQLPGFVGDPQAFNMGHIEAIRAGLWWV